MNRCAFAYCSGCGMTGLLAERPGKSLRGEVHGPIPPEIESAIAACECSGRFRSESAPLCPGCHEPLDPRRASVYIDAAVQPVAAGWKWQQSWRGIYCMVVEERAMSMRSLLTLVPIDRNGEPRDRLVQISPTVAEVLAATKAMYSGSGFEEPWIGYLALAEGSPVGTCGFKSPPISDRAEIAYFTFPEFEGKGYGTAMAAELVGVASRHDPHVDLTAQTLPGRNASHRILEKVGFRFSGSLEHPDDGTVWEWVLKSLGTGNE